MTSEIVQFKCPSCGQKLTEEEYWHVCQIQKSQLDQMLEKELEHRTSHIEQKYMMEIQNLNEKNERERDEAVSRIVNEEKSRLQKQYDIKEKQLATAQAENAKLLDEKISQAIIQTVEKHRQKEKESELQYGRILSINKELVEKVEKLEKVLDNIPPELRGTAGELVLQEELQKEFPTDKFTSKKVGVEMADIIQTIVTETGQRLPIPIVYDKKMADRVTSNDINKAKRYKIIHNTDYCIIVTAKGIRTNRFTEEREGILLVHPIALLDVAGRIRHLIVETAKLARHSEALQTKQTMVYNYVTSSVYNREWKIIMDIKFNLDELQRSEDRYHKKTSEKRKQLIDSWFDLDDKNHSIISDILQGDEKRDKEDTSDMGHDVS